MTKTTFVIEMDTNGDVVLSGTGVTELPDNLSVGGSLDLRGTGITSTATSI
jgi:hypothetical protein